MNTFIAKAHRLQRKSIGLIVASGSVLAFILSFILIVAGIEMTALMHPLTSDRTGQIVYAIVWGIAALMIGILIERLTTTNSTKLRIMRDKVELIEADLAQINEPTEATKTEFDKEIAFAKKGRGSIIFLMSLGTGLSMMCESFIIHFLFVSWEPVTIGPISINVGWIASLFLSGLVSYTLISSELHKKLDAEVIHEALNADNFLAIAASANIKDHVNEQLLEQATTQVKEVTDSSAIRTAIGQAVVKNVDDAMDGRGQIVLRIDDEREQKRLQIAHERELTKSQLRIVPREGEMEPITSMISFDVPQRQKSKNHVRLEDLYQKNGEEYFTPRKKNFLSRELGISVRHIDRILEQIMKESA